MLKMNEEQLKLLEIAMLKEEILGKIIVWLKAKGLWEECKKDIELELKDE